MATGTIPELDSQTNATVAQLSIISLEELRKQDFDYPSSKKLLNSAQNLGFFYLDIRDSTNSLVNDVNALFDAMEVEELMLLDDQEKEELTSNHLVYGFKTFKHLPNGMRTEILNLLADDILCKDTAGTYPKPKLLNRQDISHSLQRYTASCHEICCLILKHVEHHLGITPDVLLDCHGTRANNGSSVSFTRTPPATQVDAHRVGFNMHTDHSSVTLVFHRVLGGLQVLLPDNGKGPEWAYIMPIPGHAIVNFGDALHQLSGGTVRSAVHRVTSPPGVQARNTRHSLVYFECPDDEVVLKPLIGVVDNTTQQDEDTEYLTMDQFRSHRLTKRDQERRKMVEEKGKYYDTEDIGDVFGQAQQDMVLNAASRQAVF